MIKLQITRLIVLSVLAFLACIKHAESQTPDKKEKPGLFKIGVNLNTFNTGVMGEANLRPGLAIGVSPKFELSETFYFKPELSLAMKGARIEYNEVFEPFEGEAVYRLTYVELPLMVGYRALDFLSIEGGGYFGYKLGGRFNFEGTFDPDFAEFDQTEFNGFDYGLAVGLKVGPIGVRYYHGFGDLFDSDLSRQFIGSAQNQTVQIYFQRQ